jgi:hypothetical protein
MFLILRVLDQVKKWQKLWKLSTSDGMLRQWAEAGANELTSS